MDAPGKARLYAKMAAVMAELSNIPKTGKNTHFNYSFVTADAVADKVRDLLSSKGVAFFASIVGRELLEVRKGSEKTDPKTGEVTRVVAINSRWVVNFAFTFADSETGATETQTWTAEADSGDDKGINKCATAAEKYFLLKTFIVSSADEPDADADGGKKRPQNAQNGNKPQQPSQPPPTPSSPPASSGKPPLASAGENASPSSMQSGSPSGGDFANKFPASEKWSAGALYDAMQDYFNTPAHFEHHMDKHAADYNGLTFEEAKTLVRQLHWNYDKEQCKRLLAYAHATFRIGSDVVLEAMSEANGKTLKRMRDWDGGSYAHAQAALEAWAKRQAEKDVAKEGAAGR